MLGSLKGLMTTFIEFFQPVVTVQYPEEHLPIAPRWMGFPVLTWDKEISEPYCTGCMVCIRYCPTECMSATMKDNPLHTEGKSKRRKIVGDFEINYGRCIVCGICVDVCNFDAIEMSQEHELSVFARNDNRADLSRLLQLGYEYQENTGWSPTEKDQEGENVKT
jgi:NADH-quinone oxidoreductase subunit I